MTGRVLVLGGTGEARRLATALVDDGVDVLSSLAGRVADPLLPPGEVRIGGEAMTRSIVQRLSVDEAQADGFKTKFGLDATKLDGTVVSSLTPVVDSILQEVDRSRKYYHTELGGSEVAHCILCGGVSDLPGLAAYVSQRLNISVQMGNPWAEVNFPAQIQSQLFQVAQGYSIAVGLAMRSEAADSP